MSTKSDKRFTIRMFPWRAGLASAGQRTSIPEDQLWDATNVTAMLDGMMGKAPGTTQWGQTIKVPVKTYTDGAETSKTSFIDFLAGTIGFVDDDNSNSLIAHDTSRLGLLKTAVAAGSGTENYVLSHSVGTLSSGSEWAIRFSFSGSNLPAYTPAATTPNTFVFRVAATAGSGKEFAVHSGGIYYKAAADDTYVLVVGSANAGGGSWTNIEVQCDDASGDTTVYLNDSLVDTISSALIKDVTPAATSDLEFLWRVEGSGDTGTQYNTSVGTVMYRDVVTDTSVDPVVRPFDVVTIDGVADYQFITSGGSSQSALLIAAGSYIYVDNGLRGVWIPLQIRQHREVFFSKYRAKMVWLDHDGSNQSKTWLWDGRNAPEQQDDAPPIKMVSEHQQRLIAAGDPLNPLRAYYSAGRKPNTWYSPSPTNVEDQFDVLLEAGYVEVPSGEGDEITAIWGDYYGMAIIWTKKGAWKWSGYGPTSFRVDAIVGVDLGCEGPQCVTQVGNDLWFLGRQGLQSFAATDKFGDLQSQFPSAPIQDLWTQNPTSVKRISTHFLSRARLEYNPPQGLVYMAVPITGQTGPESVYVFNVNTQAWLGPWSYNSRAMANVQIGVPRLEVMMHGDVEGIVHYTDQSHHKHGAGGTVAMTLASASLNGRSLPEAAQLIGLEKAWKVIRLYVLPRGDWEFTVDAQVNAQESMSQVTKNQNSGGDNRYYTLTNDWKINDNPGGRRRSLEEMQIIEILPDLRGPNMNFTIKQGTDGQNLVIQGAEIEFTAAGYEEE